MTDTFARMKQLIGSTAEWAAHDIVLGYGEIGIERVSAAEYKAKVGDGTAKWSALPYLSAAPGISSVIQTALDAKLALAGGTMKGDLILDHEGAKPNEAVTYTQLQNAINQFNAGLSGKLATAGGSMTGPLMLSAAGSQPLEAVTLDQMNKAISAISITTGGGLVFAGTVDLTIPYAAPVPAPQNGHFYTVVKTGSVHATWHAHLSNPALASVSVGDYVIFDSASSVYRHISNAINLNAYVPLAGTNAMTGNIDWAGVAGSKKGVNIIDGKGGTLNDVVIDDGQY